MACPIQSEPVDIGPKRPTSLRKFIPMLGFAATILFPVISAAEAQTSVSVGGVKRLPARAVADYQLGGAYPPPSGVNVVVRDSSEAPVSGLYNICYVNGFQSQPGIDWPNELLVAKQNGKPLADPNWPDEYLLNVSSEHLRNVVLERITVTISTCSQAGFDAVEFDNLDSYARSAGALRRADMLAFAAILVRTAHDYGLAAGQKNTPQLTNEERKKIGFDFVVSEECHRYNECGEYTRFYGDQVINIEYTDDLRGRFHDVCADPATPRNTVLRDRMLLPAARQGHYFAHCQTGR